MFKFLEKNWIEIIDQGSLINRHHINSIEYDGHILEIYTGVRRIKTIANKKEYEKFKNFVIYGCTI